MLALLPYPTVCGKEPAVSLLIQTEGIDGDAFCSVISGIDQNDVIGGIICALVTAEETDKK